MQMQEIKLEEIEPTIRKIFAAGGDFTFYPKGTSMHPFVEQGRDKITLAPIQDQVRKYDVILYKRKNGAFVLHRVVGKRADGYIFRGDNHFVIKIGSQIKDSLCRVFGDGVQYEWRENDDKVIIPDVSIICNLRDRKNISFTGIPRFVMEVLSNATEKYDRHEKMNIYCKVGVSEYWIVDWRKKSVEIYLFDFEEDGTGYPYLYKTVTAQNKEELQLVMFPNLKITFEELFDLGEY